jgi:alkylation response protein AidB-like acyl-CoA dehydrogenase
MVLDDPIEQQIMLARLAREFVEQRSSLRTRLEAAQQDTAENIWRASAGLGWLGLLLPEEAGGGGASLSDAAVVFEEMGKGLVPGPHLSSGVLCGGILAATGAQAAVLETLAAGSEVWALAFTEADARWEPAGVRAEAREADGGYRLRGVKQYVQDAGIADQLLVCARSVESGELVILAVPADAEGVVITEMRGWNIQPFFEVILDEAKADYLVAAGAEAERALESALEQATVLLCAYLIGAAERVYEITLRYAHTRRQFGQAIARFQRVQDHLIDMRNAIDRASVATLQALEDVESDSGRRTQSISLAKGLVSDGFFFCCEEAHHVHAGIGSDKDYGLYLYSQASHTYYHYLGSPADHEERLARVLGF